MHKKFFPYLKHATLHTNNLKWKKWSQRKQKKPVLLIAIFSKRSKQIWASVVCEVGAVSLWMNTFWKTTFFYAESCTNLHTISRRLSTHKNPVYPGDSSSCTNPEHWNVYFSQKRLLASISFGSFNFKGCKKVASKNCVCLVCLFPRLNQKFSGCVPASTKFYNSHANSTKTFQSHVQVCLEQWQNMCHKSNQRMPILPF